MTIGFDLTQFGSAPRQNSQPQQQVAREPEPAPVQREIPLDPSLPQSINEALTRPISANVTDENGNEFEDKLSQKAPGLKRQLFQIDKFASPVEPVQIVDKDGRKIWIDRKGNNILDPSTGQILLKPQEANTEDRDEINYHDNEGDSLTAI